MESQLNQAKNHFASHSICYRLIDVWDSDRKTDNELCLEIYQDPQDKDQFFMVEIKISP